MSQAILQTKNISRLMRKLCEKPDVCEGLSLMPRVTLFLVDIFQKGRPIGRQKSRVMDPPLAASLVSIVGKAIELLTVIFRINKCLK